MGEKRLIDPPKVATSRIRVKEKNSNTPVRMCYCGYWPRLEMRRGFIIIHCDRCGEHTALHDEFDLDGAINEWNQNIEEVKKLYG